MGKDESGKIDLFQTPFSLLPKFCKSGSKKESKTDPDIVEPLCPQIVSLHFFASVSRKLFRTTVTMHFGRKKCNFFYPNLLPWSIPSILESSARTYHIEYFHSPPCDPWCSKKCSKRIYISKNSFDARRWFSGSRRCGGLRLHQNAFVGGVGDSNFDAHPERWSW